jgi:hypothetical protein
MFDGAFDGAVTAPPGSFVYSFTSRREKTLNNLTEKTRRRHSALLIVHRAASRELTRSEIIAVVIRSAVANV